MNREKAIRQKYYDLLNGNLTYDSGSVNVWDTKAEDTTNNIYVLLSDQPMTNLTGFTGNFVQSDIYVEIIDKTQDTVSKDVLDEIDDQIQAILYPALQNGVTTNGWQIVNFELKSLNYPDFSLFDTRSGIRKLLIFTQQVAKIAS